MKQEDKDPAVTNAMICFIGSFFVAVLLGFYFESILVGLIIFGLGIYATYKVLANSVRNSAPNTTNTETTIASFKSRPQSKPRPKRATFESRVAGAQYHCDDSDIGGFMGYIAPDPNNEYDKKAIAIYRNDGKHLGFIPKDDIARLKRWASQPSLPCIGYIFDGDMVEYWGKITIVDAEPQQTELEMVKIAYDMVVRDGAHILPEEFRVEGDDQPTSRKEWLEVLDARINELSGDK